MGDDGAAGLATLSKPSTSSGRSSLADALEGCSVAGETTGNGADIDRGPSAVVDEPSSSTIVIDSSWMNVGVPAENWRGTPHTTPRHLRHEDIWAEFQRREAMSSEFVNEEAEKPRVVKASKPRKKRLSARDDAPSAKGKQSSRRTAPKSSRAEVERVAPPSPQPRSGVRVSDVDAAPVRTPDSVCTPNSHSRADASTDGGRTEDQTIRVRTPGAKAKRISPSSPVDAPQLLAVEGSFTPTAATDADAEAPGVEVCFLTLPSQSPPSDRKPPVPSVSPSGPLMV